MVWASILDGGKGTKLEDILRIPDLIIISYEYGFIMCLLRYGVLSTTRRRTKGNLNTLDIGIDIGLTTLLISARNRSDYERGKGHRLTARYTSRNTYIIQYPSPNTI